MSKRNLILLIIILVVIVAILFGVFSSYKQNGQNNIITQSTNFIASFLPFGKVNNVNPANNTSTNPSGLGSTTSSVDMSNVKLRKVSSFPIAGYGVFMEERFKDVANPIAPIQPIQPTTEPVTQPVNTSSNVSASATTPTKVASTKTTTKTTIPAPVVPTAPLTEFAPAVRYVNKATGNIYQTFADNIDERQFSSTLIPKVYEAYFGNSGQSVIMRYLKDDNKTIETFIGNLPKTYLGSDSTETNEVTGSFLPENISDMSISPDASQMFYIFNSGDSAIGDTFSLADNTKVQVFNSSFTEWLSSWPNNNLITITTKPAAGVPGYMYAINTGQKDLNKVLGGINGLTTLTSPDGKMVLYSNDSLSLNIFNISTGNSTQVGLNTLPEKCVWGNASDVVFCAVPKSIDQSYQYPDSWYQGEVSFSDQIWKIDATTGSTTMISDPVTVPEGEDVDAIKLSVDQNQNYLFFINKKDSYLWELELN